MGWLAALHSVLISIGERPLPGVCKLVVFALCLPVFELHNLLFKVTYRLGSIRLRHACRRQRLLGLNNNLSELDFNLIDRRCLGGSVEGLQHSKARFEALIGSRNFHSRNHSSPH